MQRIAQRPHGILWEGRSLLDDSPIVAVVTSGTSNAKTGPMAQVWILLQDLAPHEAKRTGRDHAICGHCPMHSACYVLPFQAPLSVWEHYRRGRYAQVAPAAFERVAIRWGAYGDPALLPAELVRACNSVARTWTGYTHQYHQPWASWCKGVFMASVETHQQELRLRAEGWGTFRAGRSDGSDRGATELCAHELTGETCVECRACNGAERAIYVPAHGAKAKDVPAERLARRK